MSSSLKALLAIGTVTALVAAPSSVGTIRCTGDFRVDGSVVHGNATVFDGDVVETAAAGSVLQWNGAQLTLAPSSRAKIFGDRTVLEKGSGLLRDSGGQSLEAASLRISPAAKDSTVQVAVKDSSHISVFALAGKAQVYSSKGLLLASVQPGIALAFDTTEQTGGSTWVSLSGTLTSTSGKYFLKDNTSGVVSELRGMEKDLEAEKGKKIELTGSIIPNASPTSPATEVVQVNASHLLAAALPAAAGAGAAAAAGMSTAATVAVVGGVAVAGTAGGLAAAGTFSRRDTVSVP
jgi:hypothetical protein